MIARFGEDLDGRTFAVWGLAFKPETDDMREASSVTIINALTARGAKIKAYDPKARHEAESFYLKGNENVEYVDSKYTALNDADAVILVTEWQEFRSPLKSTREISANHLTTPSSSTAAISLIKNA